MLPISVEGADTSPKPTPMQNDLLVAMHVVYLVLLLVELFRYADEQSTLCGQHRPNLLEKGQVVTEKQVLQFLTPPALLRMERVAMAPNFCTMLD